MSDLCDGHSNPQNYYFNSKNIIDLGNNIKKINDISFDIFEMKRICKEKTLNHIAYEILSNFQFFDYFINEKTLKSFMNEIATNYGNDNPYHNSLHGGDVMQTMYIVLTKGKLQEVN